MKTLLKIAALLLVLFVVVLLALPHFVSSDLIKERLVKQIESSTGRTLTIKGSIDLAFLPLPRVAVSQATLSNPKGWPSDEPFVQMDKMDVSVELLPLLGGNVRIKKLSIDKPVIHLMAKGEEQSNWSFGDGTAEKTPAAKKGGSPGNMIMVNSLDINDGTVTYVDSVSKKKWQLNHLDLESSLSKLQQQLELKGKGEWNGEEVRVDATADSLSAILSQNKSNFTFNAKSKWFEAGASGSVVAKMFSGKLSASSPSVKELIKWVNPESDASALSASAFSFKSESECGLNKCDLNNAEISYDDIKATGSVKLVLNGSVPQVDLNLSTNTINLNKLLPSGKSESKEASAHETAKQPAKLDLSALRSFNMTATIKNEGVTYDKFKVGSSLLRAKLDHGFLGVDIVNAEIYGGKGNITVNLDGRYTPPALDTRIMLTDIQVQELLKAASDSDAISGKATFQMAASGQGDTPDAIVANLNGNGNVNIADGKIRGVNLLNVMSSLQGKAGGGDTAFSQMKGSFTIAKGILTNKDLILTAPGMSVTGAGQVDLPKQTIDYRLSPELAGREKDKAGLTVPVLVRGSLSNPTIQPDAAGLIKDAISDPSKLKEQLKNTRGGLKDAISGNKDAVKDLLKGFGR